MIQWPKIGRAVSICVQCTSVFPVLRCFLWPDVLSTCQVLHEWFRKKTHGLRFGLFGTTLAALGDVATRGLQLKVIQQCSLKGL
jgi:hypothetical protein